MRAPSLFLLVLSALASASRASAEASAHAVTSSLSWVRMPGAEDCVATQALAKAVEQRLGRDAFVSAAQADVSIEGRVEPKKGGFFAVLTLRDASGKLLGSREVSRPGPACDAMTAPLSLVIALMIDPDASSPRPSPQPEAALPQPPPPAPPPIVIVQREEVPVPAPPRPPLLRFEGSSAAMAAAGLLPGAALGFGALGMIEPRGAIPFVGFGSYWLDSKAAGQGTASASFSALLFGAGLCPLFSRGRVFGVYACATGHLGALMTKTSGFEPARGDVTYLLWNAALELRATWMLVGPLALRAGAQAVVPLLRPAFSGTLPDGTSSELFKVAPVLAVADLGLGLALP